MDELKELKILSLEIGQECNLAHIHNKCPINVRTSDNKFGNLTKQRIISLIDEAIALGFSGHIAFHYYNEPLLYIDLIKEIINERPENKYLLWTNGELLSETVEENSILNLFDNVIITCYDYNKINFYKKLQNFYKNIKIAVWELDDRINVYENKSESIYGCDRINCELPIDYYGNVHLCCQDWNNEYKIGNVLNSTLKSIVQGDKYRKLRNLSTNNLLKRDCPAICRKCNKQEVRQGFDIENMKGCI